MTKHLGLMGSHQRLGKYSISNRIEDSGGDAPEEIAIVKENLYRNILKFQCFLRSID